MRWLAASLSITLLVSCNEETAPSAAAAAGSAAAGSGSAAARPAGGGGGFSADLAKEFASASGSGGGAAKAGSAEAAAKAGSAEVAAKAGDAKAGSAEAAAKAGDAKAGDAKAGSAEAAAKAGDAKAGSAEAAAKAGDAKAGDAKAGDAKVPETPSRVGTSPVPILQGTGGSPKKVVVSAELAAIKFGMLPNWERDVQDAGTLSLAVKIPGRNESAVFVFRYGYEDASAPADRDAYKKWLSDKRVLTVRQDRQGGSSWLLEGNDGSGNPAFRVVVNWGGKKLICYGSLYRDGESSKLGDLRDQTVLQAKQICETVAL